MLAVIAKVKVKPEQVERFLTFLRADVEGTLREPGCVRFEVLRDEADPNVFYMYEIFKDRAAYALHQEAPYFKAFFAEAGDTLAGPPEGYFANPFMPAI
jgi:(4S)-4-hydroxy-5-phosphonooxypentane-2,3-dione isomerase